MRQGEAGLDSRGNCVRRQVTRFGVDYQERLIERRRQAERERGVVPKGGQERGALQGSGGIVGEHKVSQGISYSKAEALLGAERLHRVEPDGAPDGQIRGSHHFHGHQRGRSQHDPRVVRAELVELRT